MRFHSTFGGAGGSPGGAAGGDLSGTYPNPNVIALEETSSPARLAIGAWGLNQVLTRTGANAASGVGIDVLAPTVVNAATHNWLTELGLFNTYVTALMTVTLCPAADVTSWPVNGWRMLTKANLTAFGMAVALGGTQTINGGAAGVGIALLQGSTLIPSATQTAPAYLFWRQSATSFWVF